MHWLLLVISVVFALAAAATVAVPQDVPKDATTPPAPEAKPPASEAAKEPKPPPSAQNKPKAQMPSAEVRKIAEEQYKQCLNDWDAATHMTKQEWQRTCRRLADNRAKFRVDFGSGNEIRPPSR
jgi:hypothetical protein